MTHFKRLELSIDATTLGNTPEERRDALAAWMRSEGGMVAAGCHVGVHYCPKTGKEIGRWSIDGRDFSRDGLEYDL